MCRQRRARSGRRWSWLAAMRRETANDTVALLHRARAGSDQAAIDPTDNNSDPAKIDPADNSDPAKIDPADNSNDPAKISSAALGRLIQSGATAPVRATGTAAAGIR